MAEELVNLPPAEQIDATKQPPPPGYVPGPAQYPSQVVGGQYQPAPSQFGYAGQQSSTSVVVVGQQPLVSAEDHGPIVAKPSNYLAFSVVNMLCCCFILGIIALIYSLQVDSAWTTRRYEEARSNANTSKILNIIGFVIGIICWVIGGIVTLIYIIVVVAAVGQAAAVTNDVSSINRNSYYN